MFSNWTILLQNMQKEFSKQIVRWTGCCDMLTFADKIMSKSIGWYKLYHYHLKRNSNNFTH